MACVQGQIKGVFTLCDPDRGQAYLSPKIWLVSLVWSLHTVPGPAWAKFSWTWARYASCVSANRARARNTDITSMVRLVHACAHVHYTWTGPRRNWLGRLSRSGRDKHCGQGIALVYGRGVVFAGNWVILKRGTRQPGLVWVYPKRDGGAENEVCQARWILTCFLPIRRWLVVCFISFCHQNQPLNVNTHRFWLRNPKSTY